MASLTFSLARLPAYLLLGALAAYSGIELRQTSGFHQLQTSAQILTGAIILAAGLLMALLARMPARFCKLIHGPEPRRNNRLLAVLGFLFGLSPCVPMMAVLARVGIESSTLALGTLCMLFFGVGTMLSPLLLLGAASGMFSQFLAHRTSAFDIFRRACGLALCYSGVLLLLAV